MIEQHQVCAACMVCQRACEDGSSSHSISPLDVYCDSCGHVSGTQLVAALLTLPPSNLLCSCGTAAFAAVGTGCSAVERVCALSAHSYILLSSKTQVLVPCSTLLGRCATRDVAEMCLICAAVPAHASVCQPCPYAWLCALWDA